MTLPQHPDDVHHAEGDTFDFEGAQRRARTYMRQTMHNAKDMRAMHGLSRDHLIAVAAVGGYLIAPTIAGIRKSRRKKARRRMAKD